MRNLIIILLLFVGYIADGQAVLYYLNSGFETATDQATWTATTDDAALTWKYKTGGEGSNPPIAKQGTKNAFLYKNVIPQKHGLLISKVLDIGTAGKPILKFWHAQYNNVWGNDELRILFRPNSTSAWDTVRTYINPVNAWTERVIDIFAIGSKYKTDNFQFAFAATIGNGWGVVIDSVTVEETQSIPVFVKNMSIAHQPHYLIPSGAPDIPVDNIILKIYGNNGTALLKNITVTPVGSGISLLEPDGFKLFKTQDLYYTPWENNQSTLIATGSLVNDKVYFTNINEELDLGNNYIWFTISAKDDIGQSSTVRFHFEAESVEVIDTLLPASDFISNQSQTLSEVVLFDDFESGSSFLSISPDFEIAKPLGKKVGSSYDPFSAYSGDKILGTDLTVDGAYRTGIDSAVNPYYAYSDNIDLTYYIDLGMFMHRKFEFGANTTAVIEISNNGGINWNRIWDSHYDQIADPYWEEWLNQQFSDFASKKDSFRIRIGIENNSTDLKPGFNIDNLAILGRHLETEVGVTTIISPFNDCIGCNNDTVKAVFKNYAEGPAPGVIPVYFGLWGVDSIIVRDTIYGGIPQNDSITFTFGSLAQFPTGHHYDKFVVGVDLTADQDHRNDTLTKKLFIQNTIMAPDMTDFEHESGLWFKEAGSSWECLDMHLTMPTDSSSPIIWVLSASGNYSPDETTYIESNCYDFSDEERHIVQFDYWANTELYKDGARIDYSDDHAQNWRALYDNLHSSYWGWFADTVEALGSQGWSGSSNWRSVRAVLPASMDTASRAKFRLTWASDATTSHPQGFAINDFEIFDAPPDFGVSSIEIPKDTCQYCTPDSVKIYVKNYGYNKLAANDELIVGVEVESLVSLIDTIVIGSEILPGDSAIFTIYTPMDVTLPGSYNIMAYTLMEQDPFFYSPVSNDTSAKSFDIWQLPFGIEEDTISSRRPDTVVIRPYYNPDYEYLWDDNSTDSVYHATSSTTYHVTVTEINHGCRYIDSIYVELLYNDIGIDSIVWPQSQCELSNSEEIQVQIRNLGTDSLVTGDRIHLFYQLNGGSQVHDSITLSSPFLKQSYLWHTFTGNTEDFSTEGGYSIKAFTQFGGDTIDYNDTIERTITVFGYPELNLGNDTVIQGLNHTIEVDPSFESYLWNDGVSQGSRLIDTSGVYWLDVMDSNGCPASDTIKFWFKIRDIRPLLMLNPTSECNREDTEQVVLRFENNGSDTLYAGDTIRASYTVNTGAFVTESFTVNQMLPGQFTDHTFLPQIDLSALGTYNFELTASSDGDLRPENDALQQGVYTSTNPVIDLGIDEEETYQVTEMVLDAGYGENWVYLWHDGSTNRTYTVTNTGTVRVLVTDALTGCYGGDTAFVSLDILDYMISSINVEASTCSGDYDEVEVLILNNGNLSRQGAEISLEYLLGTEHLFSEEFVYSGIWQAGFTRTHTTQNIISLNDAGSQQLHINISTVGDLRPENDNFTKTINVLPSPVVDFGGDALEVDLPYLLDAGSGYEEYLWSDGSDESTYTATQPGTYSVTVTGNNGCVTIQTVYVDTVLAIYDPAGRNIEVNIYPNPATDFITVEASFEFPGPYILEVFNAQNSEFIHREISAAEYKEEFYIGNLPPGLYFIRIRNEGLYVIAKMIIQ